MDNKQILEALKMQPLSEEEKSSRHILGRLYGPIATCNSSTRNGRRYNKALWEKALADDLFKEKIANKSLFLELGHPVNREETDMEKVCACIPEMPKIVNGDLYAYVDILDTNNGKLLKTLCDYGFIPGISSRGSGDIMANDEVDPETFFLETWDIVQIPAVKDARLQMCESLDTKTTKLKKALTESFNKASKESKKIMKEALDNLDITIDADVEPVNNLSDEDVPWSEDEEETDVLLETNELSTEDIPWSEDEENDTLLEADDEDTEEVEEEPTEEIEETEEEVEETPVEEIEEPAKDSEIIAMTIGDVIEQLKDYDEDLTLKFEPIIIDDVEYNITGFEFEDQDDIVIAKAIVDSQETGDDIEDESEDDSANEEELETEDTSSEEAEDVGDDETEVMESLKEMIRQKNLLEQEVKTLKSGKTVRDTEVETLKEELSKYKLAFARTSELAAKAKSYETKAKSLEEQLQTKDKEITKLKSTQASALNESVQANKQKIVSLKETLGAKEDEIIKLNEQVTTYEKKIVDRTKAAKFYKSKLDETLQHYINYRAGILGVNPNEITNKLNEQYSLEDIDKACDIILNESLTISKLPYGMTNKAKIKITESKTTKNNPNYGYEIDDSLLELAGLKKY